MSSSRFPAKMMSSLGGIPLVRYVYERCLRSKEAGVTAVITSTGKTDDALYEYCCGEGMEVFRGSLGNVLDRYATAARHYGADIVCRVCGDSPFVDTMLIDTMFRMSVSEAIDYVAPGSNTCIAGLDSEIIRYDALVTALKYAAEKDELEHVTPFIRKNTDKFKIKLIDVNLRPDALSALTLTVDYPGDLVVCNRISDMLSDKGYDFTSQDILDIVYNNKEILRINRC